MCYAHDNYSISRITIYDVIKCVRTKLGGKRHFYNLFRPARENIVKYQYIKICDCTFFHGLFKIIFKKKWSSQLYNPRKMTVDSEKYEISSPLTLRKTHSWPTAVVCSLVRIVVSLTNSSFP